MCIAEKLLQYNIYTYLNCWWNNENQQSYEVVLNQGCFGANFYKNLKND